MNCGDAFSRLDRYHDGELDMDENVEVVRHLESCPACASVFEGDRLFFDEVRRQAAGPPAPAVLRQRIASGISRSRPAARPWPFARALVPAAAAALLVGLFVTILSQPVGAAGVARWAVAWHDGQSASAVPFTSGPELAGFFGSKGQKACIHQKSVTAGMNYDYRSACVESSDLTGEVTCWWTAACPASGKRMSHASFRAPPGFEKSLTPVQRKVLEINGRAVIMNARDGFV